MIRLGQNNIFALYSLPYNDNHYLIRQDGKQLHEFTKSSLKEEGFVVYPFMTSENFPSVFIKKDALFKNPKIEFLSQHQGSIKSINKKTYLKNIQAFIKATQTNYKKIIFSRIETVNLETGDLFQLFTALKELYPNTFVYLFNIPEVGCWMGASPEIFVNQYNETDFQTVALAGTQRDLGLPLDNVNWGNKEIEEQAIVERYIERILERQDSDFQKTVPYTSKAGKMLHLKTKFRFRPNNDLCTFLEELHPTPAVCGIPKENAKDFIVNHEMHERGYYCGYLGPLNIEEQTHLFVNLRCMQVFKDKFALYIGGGITADSNALKEWEETEMKSQTMADVIERIYTNSLMV